MFGVSFFNQLGKQKDIRSMHGNLLATERYVKPLYADLYADREPRGEGVPFVRSSASEEQLFESYGHR